MFLHNFCCLGCNSLSNQHCIWCLFCLFSLVVKKKILLVLSLASVLIQLFNKLINEKSQTNKDQKSAYYFYNSIISIEEFDPNLLKIDKKLNKCIDIYYIGYSTIKKIDDCENIYRVNPLYLIIVKKKMDILSATPLKKKWK